MIALRSILILSICLLVFSCEKEQLTYRIEGTILDEYSKTEISNISVKLFQKEFKNGVLSDNYTFVNEVKTTAEGKYAFVIDRVKIYEIKIEIASEDYYFKSQAYSSSLLTSETVNIFDEYIEAKSWVAIILNNPFVGPNEQMNVHKSRFKEGCVECCTNGNSSFIETGDTTIICAAIGGAEVVINYGVVGSNSQYNKTLDCVPFDTTFLTINY